MSYTQSFGLLLSGKSCSIRFSSRDLPVVKQFSDFPEIFHKNSISFLPFLKFRNFSVELKMPDVSCVPVVLSREMSLIPEMKLSCLSYVQFV